MIQIGAPVQDVLTAATEAGRQLVQDGRMSPDTLSTVSRELLPRDTYIQMANQRFQQALDAVEKK
jgi:hypothetical protein